MFQKLSSAELAEITRWEERYGSGPVDPRPRVIDLSTYNGVDEFYKACGVPREGIPSGEDFIIGNEIFSAKELKRSNEQNPQPKSHPFKPHHYCLQKDLEEIKAHYVKIGR